MASFYTNEQKQQIYKRWKEQGELWFSKNPSNDPSWEEKQIIIEMKKKEAGIKSKRDIELEKRPKPKNEVRAFDRLLNDAADY